MVVPAFLCYYTRLNTSSFFNPVINYIHKEVKLWETVLFSALPVLMNWCSP